MFWAGGAPLPKTPSRSSRLLLPVVGGAAVVGLVGVPLRTGVPARPSRPEKPDGVEGSFCADAGAAPSKSMSRRFSALAGACGAACPEPAMLAAAAAARGFSRAF